MALTIGLNLGALALLALFARGLVKRHGTPVQIGVLFAVSLAASYPLRILGLLAFPVESNPAYPGLVSLDVLQNLSWLQIPGLLAYCFGYAWVDRRLGRHLILDNKRTTGDDHDVAFLAVVYGVSLAAKAYKVATGNYVSFLIGENVNFAWANIVENFHMLGWVCFAGVWLLWFQKNLRRPFHWAFFLGVNLIELSYQVVQGSKTFLILPAFILLLVSYFRTGRAPILGAGLAAAFAFLVVFPFVGAYRNYFGTEYGHSIPTVDNFSAKRMMAESYRDARGQGKSVLEQALTGLGRFAGADELYNMTSLVPGVLPYKLGKDFLSVPYALIPRAFWPSKPTISPGAEYGEVLGTITSITPFPLGEAYWNAGVPGTIVWMCMWGAFLALIMRLFDLFALSRNTAFFALAIYLAEVYWLSTGESMLAMTVGSLPKKFVIYLVVYYLASILVRPRKVRARRQTHAISEGA